MNLPRTITIVAFIVMLVILWVGVSERVEQAQFRTTILRHWDAIDSTFTRWPVVDRLVVRVDTLTARVGRIEEKISVK